MINKVVIITISFLGIVAWQTSHAATLELESGSTAVGIGHEFVVDLLLDSQGESINAVEGSLTFAPETLLELKTVSDGDSIIPIWLEKPNAASCEVFRCEYRFSGIIPGGFTGVLSPYYEGGRPGKILSFVFLNKGQRDLQIDLENPRVLLNDGKGTPAALRAKALIVKIDPNLKGSKTIELNDLTPPEPFEAHVFKQSGVYDGKYAVIFSAQDKQSGIGHYEVKEGDREFVQASSPYVLSDQSLGQEITIKAVDNAGNERLVVIKPGKLNVGNEYAKWQYLGILVLLAILGLAARLYVRKKYQNQ